MTSENTVEPGGAILVVATRLSALDPNGFIIPGADVFVTDTLLKVTVTPVNEAGDAPTIKNAAGNLGVYAKKGDIRKWDTINIELVTPDPQLEALLTGGTVYNDTSVALGAGGTPTVAAVTTGGTLAALTYDYAVANYNQYGQSTIGPDVIYGRIIGLLQRIGLVPNIGTQTTSGAVDGATSSIPMVALTEAIPIGTNFTITGDTNTPPVVFTAAETGLVGAVTLAVDTVTVTTSIAAAVLKPVFVDTGSVKPVGLPSLVDNTAGPGLAVGQQAHALGVVANPNGVGLEFFMERIIDGHQATDGLGYIHFVMPKACNFVVGPRDATNAEMASVFVGEAFENDNWGSGPAGDWQFDSSKIFQWAYCSEFVVPEPTYVAQSAGF